ncbi:MAG: hypothetical protein IPL79_07915 [Myxococcales bacterium]|nr:hypothetical protein [Myxococcales bacterium]
MAEPTNPEDEVIWLGVLDELVAGRGADVPCPFCGARPLLVTREGALTRVSCSGCKRFIEGQLG